MTENSYENLSWKTQIWNQTINLIQHHKHLKDEMKI